MSASNKFESALMNLIFQNANTGLSIGSDGLHGSSTSGNLYVSLHTSDPGEAGDQNTGEANYTGYSRVGVPRSTLGWTYNNPSGNVYISNAGAITFPISTGGSSNVVYFGIGSDSTGNGNLLFSGALTSYLNISNNITPSYQANTLLIYID